MKGPACRLTYPGLTYPGLTYPGCDQLRPSSVILALLVCLLAAPVHSQQVTKFRNPKPSVMGGSEHSSALSRAPIDRFKIPTPLVLPDQSGWFSTVSKTGSIDLSNPFFKTLGTNGRTCLSCHTPTDGWSVTPRSLAVRFLLTGGRDPIFRPVDGANCPSSKVSTLAARASAYSLLLGKGLIRISLPMPQNAEFSIVQIQDPQACRETSPSAPALYRRPLPSTNLTFLSDVMWDGRNNQPGTTLNARLRDQASAATVVHAEATLPPSDEQLAAIVAFETRLFTAQERDNAAGSLTAAGATGGARNLSTQAFFPGINDPDNSSSASISEAFTLYQPWINLTGTDQTTAARQSVARGEQIFNSLTFIVTGVAGLNDVPGQAVLMQTCSSCHDTPNVGNHSVSQFVNIGVTDYPARPGLDITGLPVYTVQCNTTSPASFVLTTDPGVAMISGKCADVGKTKNPVLRGLAARAPYFHNGSAATLTDVVTFYNTRFGMHLSGEEAADLAAFLSTL